MSELTRHTEMTSPQQVAADIAREFRQDATRWTQRWYAKDAFGSDVYEDDPSAVCWCLRGAIDKRCLSQMANERLALRTYEAFDSVLSLPPNDDDRLSFIKWNDDPKRTVVEVIALCDRVANQSDELVPKNTGEQA